MVDIDMTDINMVDMNMVQSSNKIFALFTLSSYIFIYLFLMINILRYLWAVIAPGTQHLGCSTKPSTSSR